METAKMDQNAHRANEHDQQDQTLRQESSSQDVNKEKDQSEETSQQTPVSEAVNADEPEKGTYGSEGGSGWANNKPGATNEEKDNNLIPTSDPENYTS